MKIEKQEGGGETPRAINIFGRNIMLTEIQTQVDIHYTRNHVAPALGGWSTVQNRREHINKLGEDKPGRPMYIPTALGKREGHVKGSDRGRL